MRHGAAAARDAAATARRSFEEGGHGEALPEIGVDGNVLAAGVAAFRLFRMAGLCESNGAARRLIRGGGARVNGRVVDSEEQSIGAPDLAEGAIKLSAGRKRHTRDPPRPPDLSALFYEILV